jgi:hypothetical protein
LVGPRWGEDRQEAGESQQENKVIVLDKKIQKGFLVDSHFILIVNSFGFRIAI